MKIKFTEPKKDGKPSDEISLLVKYMVQKLGSYQEPERKGTPRGDKIGFPFKKFAACIFVGLTNFSLKKITEQHGSDFGFSYGLLRKWNTEADFKAQQDEFQSEFALKIFQYIQSAIKKAFKMHTDYYEAKSDKKPDLVDYEPIKSFVKILNPSILDKLEMISHTHFEEVVRLREEGKVSDDEFVVGTFQYFEISGFVKYALGKKIRKYEDLSRAFLKNCILDSMNLISSKRNLSIKDQRKILGHLELLMDFIDWE
jgi:hypothetical protein